MAEASKAKSPAPRKRKKIKYATGEDEFVETGQTTLLTHPGAQVPWQENPDNPMSPDFIPVAKRTEQQKARWWALLEKRKRKVSHGVY